MQALVRSSLHQGKLCPRVLAILSQVGFEFAGNKKHCQAAPVALTTTACAEQRLPFDKQHLCCIFIGS